MRFKQGDRVIVYVGRATFGRVEEVTEDGRVRVRIEAPPVVTKSEPPEYHWLPERSPNISPAP